MFSIREMVTQINTIIHGQCEEKGLTYENSITGFAEEYYTGDSLRLRQVIINILANAVKFTDPPGLVRFTAQQIEENAEFTVIRFTMEDTGIGMEKAFLPRLYDPFVQEDATTTNRYGGSGLGMAITKNMIDLMDGSIPVIALTANAFEEDVKQCLEAGMNAHLSKPVDIDQLTKLLGRFLTERNR